MLNFYRTKVLILEEYSSVYDIYIVGISPILGKVHLIAKNAASSKSKRKIQLKRGNLLNAVIFHKNRFYLSDTSVEASFFTNLNSLNQVKALNLILEIINGFYIYPDFTEFNEIIKILKNTFLIHKYTISTASILILYLFRILPSGIKCQNCKEDKRNGYLTEYGWTCNACYLKLNKNNFTGLESKLPLNFKDDMSSIQSLNTIINTMIK